MSYLWLLLDRFLGKIRHGAAVIDPVNIKCGTYLLVHKGCDVVAHYFLRYTESASDAFPNEIGYSYSSCFPERDCLYPFCEVLIGY